MKAKKTLAAFGIAFMVASQLVLPAQAAPRRGWVDELEIETIDPAAPVQEQTQTTQTTKKSHWIDEIVIEIVESDGTNTYTSTYSVGGKQSGKGWHDTMDVETVETQERHKKGWVDYIVVETVESSEP